MAPADWVTISKSKKSSKHREWHNLSYKDGSYWIASKKASIVIGSRGFCIAVIRQTSKAQITIHDENGSHQRQLTILGTHHQVECACSMIDQILSSPHDRDKILFGEKKAVSRGSTLPLDNQTQADENARSFEFQPVVQPIVASLAELQPTASMSWQDKCRSVRSAAVLEPRVSGTDTIEELDNGSTLKQEPRNDDSQCTSPVTVDTSTSFSVSVLVLEDLMTCPITQVRFVDPVVASDGFTYEKEAIEAWISLKEKDEVVLSPHTGQPLTHHTLVSNVLARQILAKMPPAL